MIGNERLEDESNASSTLTEPISRSIRGINGSRMERGVRILYRHLRSMVFFVFLFSFLMNFTEGGRRIIRHGSAGKVSGECWRLLIISCSCLQTPFFCGAESDPAALFECLEMNRFRGNDRGFRARARRECEPPIVSTAFRARSRIFPYEWNAVRFVDRIWRILKRNSEIPCLG